MSPITLEEGNALLTRLLRGGPLRQFPKKQEDLLVVLALAAQALRGSSSLTEPEVNTVLRDWLQGFADPVGMDHVTMRRFLVDYHFLLRSTNGDAYRVNTDLVGLTLNGDARELSPTDILEDLTAERLARRRAHEKQSTK